MQSRRKYNKSQRRPNRRQNRNHTRHSDKSSFFGVRAFACALRKKFIGGGDFRGEMCNFTPLTSRDFAVLEETVRIPIDSELNLIVPDSETCIKSAGGNNRVCTKICKTSESENTEVIYRESLKPIIIYTDTTKNEKFELFNAEMKLQIIFAEKGLAPEVYMYGLINVSEQPLPPPPSQVSSMILPPPPPPPPLESSLVVKTFCVIEQKKDFFKFVDFYYRNMYDYLLLKIVPGKDPVTDPDPDIKQRIDDLSLVFNELIHKILVLYDEIARMGYLFIDLKPENIVYSRNPIDGSYKVFMIDFDTIFSASSPEKIMDSQLEKVFANNTRNAIEFNNILMEELKNRDEESKIQMRASIMKYLFCSFMIVKDEVFANSLGFPLRALMQPNISILRYMDTYARLRNAPANLPQNALRFIADHINGTLTINGKDKQCHDFIINKELFYILNKMIVKNIGNIRGLFYKYYKKNFSERDDLLYRYCYLSFNDIERLNKRPIMT